MIDYLKILVDNIDLIEQFKQSNLLYMYSDSETLSNFDNETIKTKSVKQYRKIKFTFERDTLIIQFKPHYYFNDNLHNANDLSINDCINVLNEFKELFNLNFEQLQLLKIINIEFGVNVLSPIKGTDLIDYLFLHNKKEFKYKNGLEYYKEQSNSLERIIKAYSKGIQYPEYCNIDTFRFEVKSRKARFINSLGITNFNDLLNYDNYKIFSDKLLYEFKNILILDHSINIENLSNTDKLKFKDCVNPYVWNKILKENHRHTFRNQKIKYNELLDKCGFNIHKELYSIISDKLESLKSKSNNNYTLSHPLNDKDFYTYSHIYKRWNCKPQQKKCCPITGIGLELEPIRAKYIQTKTLKDLRQNNIELYNQIRDNLLIKSYCKPAYEKNEIKHLAKQIRNRYFNPKIKGKNKINIDYNQLNLFYG